MRGQLSRNTEIQWSTQKRSIKLEPNIYFVCWTYSKEPSFSLHIVKLSPNYNFHIYFGMVSEGKSLSGETSAAESSDTRAKQVNVECIQLLWLLRNIKQYEELFSQGQKAAIVDNIDKAVDLFSEACRLA